MKTITINNDGDVTIYHYANYDAIHKPDIYASRIAVLSLIDAYRWAAKIKEIQNG